MHLIPTFILIIILVICWRWEWVGAFLYTGLGVLYIIIAWGNPWTWALIISGPLFVLGVLYLLNWTLLKRPSEQIQS
jgi:hypothetical protein